MSLDHNLIEVFDEFSFGNYKKSRDLSRKLIYSEKSNIIELSEIYVKSLVELNETPIFDIPNSITNQIINHFYEILAKTNNTINSIIELINLAYQFSNEGLGLQLYSFISIELNWKIIVNYPHIANLVSQFTNPRLLTFYLKNENISNKFIMNLERVFPNSATIKLYSKIREDFYSENGFTELNSIPDTKLRIYEIRNLILKEEYDDAIEATKSLIKVKGLSMVSKHELISKLFDSYLETDNFRQCIILFVESYFENEFLTKRMNGDYLHNQIIKSRFKLLGEKKQLIELPVLFDLIGSSNLRTKQAYEQFLKANNITKPSELKNHKESFEKEKLIYFLKNVCRQEILLLSRHFKGTNDVNEERIRICQFLSGYDEDNTLVYHNEIANITQKNAINKVISRINQGKIYVNEEKIKQLFLSSDSIKDTAQLNPKGNEIVTSEDLFLRMLNVRSFSAVNNFYSIDSNGNLIGDVDFNHFKYMFFEIRDWFVKNNEYGYGLDAYLSTKIRHGTLPNHIRSVFEEVHLVTSRGDNGYTINETWEKLLSVSNEEMTIIQNCLSEFSEKIDELSKDIKEKLIQCKTGLNEDKNDALFNFIFNDLELVMLYQKSFEIRAYKDFIDYIFNCLWRRTEDCLDKIKNILIDEIKVKYIDCLNDLEYQLSSQIVKNNINELTRKITLCKTEVQTSFRSIAEWFNRSESDFDQKYSIDLLLDTSVETIRNCNPSYGFKIKKELSSLDQISGKHHESFIDMTNIFLQNMIEHSLLGIEGLNACLRADTSQDKLRFVFINNLSEDVDLKNLNKELNFVKENWSTMDRNISYEKNSGFPKINKILRSDMSRVESELDFSICTKSEIILEIEVKFESENLVYENTNN